MIQIQFKRGTAEQWAQRAEPLGVLTVATDDHSLRIHDGVTEGGHAIKGYASYGELQEFLDSLNIEGIDGLELALAGKVAITELGKADGVTQLNPEGVVPTEQLPSWVEEILEVDDVESLPSSPAVGKLYIVKDTNELYRWSGSQERYYRITAALETSDDLSQGQINFYYTDAAMRDSLSIEGDLSYDPEAGVLSYSRSVESVNSQTGEVELTKADLGLDNVENYGIATEQDIIDAVSHSHYVTPAVSRTFAESMGFVDTDTGWTAEPGLLPALELQGIWTQLAGGITAVRNHSATVIDGRMYVYGGHTGSSVSGPLQIYDPTSDSWSQLTRGAPARHGHAAAAINGKMYVYGGYDGSAAINDLWAYDPGTDTWSQFGNGPSGRNSHSAAVLNGKMYVYGGISRTTNNDLWVVE